MHWIRVIYRFQCDISLALPILGVFYDLFWYIKFWYEKEEERQKDEDDILFVSFVCAKWTEKKEVYYTWNKRGNKLGSMH